MASYFYAGLKRGSRKALLAGPFNTFADAERWVPQARQAAETVDPWCHFDAAGVFQIETDKPAPAGVLNKLLGIVK